MAHSFCEITPRGGNVHCMQDAVAFVTYFQDGSGGKYACGKHIPKAIEEVASRPTVMADATLRIRPLGELTAKIRRARNRSR